MRAVRLLGRGLGEVLVTLGALVLLFVVWQLWWTDVTANRVQADILDSVRSDYAVAEPDPTPEPSGPAAEEEPEPEQDPALPPGATETVAIVHLPTIGEERVVMEGVAIETLDLGVLGRYPDAADPGEVGNFAVAGHRTTYGRPLWGLGDMQMGDPVVVETPDGWYVYTLERRRIVFPNQTEVLAPVPDQPGAEPEEAWMVLTACHPKFSAAERMIGYALLDRFVPRADGPPAEIGEAG